MEIYEQKLKNLFDRWTWDYILYNGPILHEAYNFYRDQDGCLNYETYDLEIRYFNGKRMKIESSFDKQLGENQKAIIKLYKSALHSKADEWKTVLFKDLTKEARKTSDALRGEKV